MQLSQQPIGPVRTPSQQPIDPLQAPSTPSAVLGSGAEIMSENMIRMNYGVANLVLKSYPRT